MQHLHHRQTPRPPSRGSLVRMRFVLQQSVCIGVCVRARVCSHGRALISRIGLTRLFARSVLISPDLCQTRRASMPSTPQDQNQEPNQEPNEGKKEETKEEAKAEENENKKEEAKKEKKKEENKEDKEKKKESWKDFIYNPGTGEFLGRTASSWGKTGGLETGGESAERSGSVGPGPAGLCQSLYMYHCTLK